MTGSPNTVDASSRDTPCFPAALAESHSNRIDGCLSGGRADVNTQGSVTREFTCRSQRGRFPENLAILAKTGKQAERMRLSGEGAKTLKLRAIWELAERGGIRLKPWRQAIAQTAFAR